MHLAIISECNGMEHALGYVIVCFSFTQMSFSISFYRIFHIFRFARLRKRKMNRRKQFDGVVAFICESPQKWKPISFRTSFSFGIDAEKIKMQWIWRWANARLSLSSSPLSVLTLSVRLFIIFIIRFRNVKKKEVKWHRNDGDAHEHWRVWTQHWTLRPVMFDSRNVSLCQRPFRL